MSYDFRALQELGWFAVVAVFTAMFEILKDFDPANVTDWGIWTTALFAASVRAAAGAALAWLVKNR